MAKEGDAAQYNMGIVGGRVVPQNYQLALEWYHKAEQKISKALYGFS